jgi:hypothetical protein
MSYRTFKKLLGETSLERKCRLLFGVTLLFLITGSFYFYARLNLRIFNTQNRQRGQLLTAQNLLTMHLEKMVDPEAAPFVKGLASWLKPQDLREYSWKFIPIRLVEPEPHLNMMPLTSCFSATNPMRFTKTHRPGSTTFSSVCWPRNSV